MSLQPQSPASQIAYFGYGSLVNLNTLQTPHTAAYRARLRGWRRVWLTRPAVEGSFAPQSGLAFLSVEPDPDGEIDGMVILDHTSSLPALDEREALYDRLTLTSSDLHFLEQQPSEQVVETYLYVAQSTPEVIDNPQILRSYLDAVAQGFFHHFGVAGLERFAATTRNMHFSIFEDRDAPIYPRAVKLSPEEESVISQQFPCNNAPTA